LYKILIIWQTFHKKKNNIAGIFQPKKQNIKKEEKESQFDDTTTPVLELPVFFFFFLHVSEQCEAYIFSLVELIILFI